MKLSFIPYHIDFLGQPIPGTDRKTQNLHVLLFGAVESFCMKGQCYASKEYLAEFLHSTPNKIRTVRSDLIRLGWLIPVKDKHGDITELKTADIEFVTPVKHPQVPPEVPTGDYGSHPQVTSATGAPPLCYNKVYNTKYISELSDTPQSSQPAAAPTAPVLQARCMQGGEVSPIAETEPNETLVFPFAETTKETSVRPQAQKEARAADRWAYAVAQKVRERLGLKGRATPPYKQGIKRWLDAGFTENDIVEANEMMANAEDEFHKSLTPLNRLSQNNMDWYQQRKQAQQSQQTARGVW